MALSGQHLMKSNMLGDSDAVNAGYLASIEQVSGRTRADLEVLFGLLFGREGHSAWDVSAVPAGCEVASGPLHESILELCEELDDSLNFGAYLAVQKDNECDNQQWRHLTTKDENILGTAEPLPAESIALFTTWWELEGGALDLPTFMAVMQDTFSELYDAPGSALERAVVDVEVEDVPSGEFGCRQYHHDTRADLLEVVDQLVRFETLKQWIED